MAAAPPRLPPLFPPTLLPEAHPRPWLEASIHPLPRGMRGDLALVLPGVPLPPPSDPLPLLLVPTCQHAAMDLVAWGDAVAAEKDLLLERFARWAKAVCEALAARGWWADFVDPCSGLAVRTPFANTPYPEVDAFEAVLRWRTSSAGGCRVLLHPSWGAAVYPATLFARAPLEVLLEAMRNAAEVEAGLGGSSGALAGAAAEESAKQ